MIRTRGCWNATTMACGPLKWRKLIWSQNLSRGSFSLFTVEAGKLQRRRRRRRLLSTTCFKRKKSLWKILLDKKTSSHNWILLLSLDVKVKKNDEALEEFGSVRFFLAPNPKTEFSRRRRLGGWTMEYLWNKWPGLNAAFGKRVTLARSQFTIR